MSTSDIIIPVWNQLKYTRICINSILANTKSPYRLIIIDNGSSQKTKEYLESLRATFSNIILERNETNEGFVRAVNKGIRKSTADYLCILNNDTIVTDGWLEEMIDVAKSDPKIGIVNPSSNNLGQKPSKGEGIYEFSERLKKYKGEYIDLSTALGFCMLVKRIVIDKIGVFDEVFDVGNFEDTDFCLRARRENFNIVRAMASYVHHKEGTSFRILKTYKKGFDRNRRIFEERWGKQKRLLFILMEPQELDKACCWKIDKEIERNAWIYIACRKGLPSPRVHSRIIVYNFEKVFFLKILFKILFKKKRFDEIYCNNREFLKVVKFLKPIHQADATEISFSGA